MKYNNGISKVLRKAIKSQRPPYQTHFMVISLPGKWVHWGKKVTDYVYPTDHEPEYTNILVPNVDNVRTEYLINTIAKQSRAVLLIGEQGTAKTVMINNYMNHYNPEFHVAQSVNFSSATTPYMFQVNNWILIWYLFFIASTFGLLL